MRESVKTCAVVSGSDFQLQVCSQVVFTSNQEEKKTKIEAVFGGSLKRAIFPNICKRVHLATCYEDDAYCSVFM